MTPSQTAERFYEAIQTGNTDLLVSLLDENQFELIVPCSTGVLSGIYRGKQTFLTEVLPKVFAYVDPEKITFCKTFKIMSADGARVVSIAQNDGLAKSGRGYNQVYAHFFTVRDSKITQIIEFYDSALADNALWGDTEALAPSEAFTMQAL